MTLLSPALPGARPGGTMAYREVTMIEVKEVLRQWLSGHSRKGMAKWVGLDRNTIRRYLQAASSADFASPTGSTR